MAGIDVSEDDFQDEVLERSETIPVVVDFWAAWCRPCRTLTPILEEAAAARAETVALAKVDTEANPRLAAYFNVHGIPAVKVFRRREVVAQFVGARPAARVARFFDDLAPSELDDLLAAGDEASLRRAVELDPRRGDTAVALAQLLHKNGRDAEALAVLGPVNGGFRADRLAARIRLEVSGDVDLDAAFAALDSGEVDRGLDLLLAAAARESGHGADIRQVAVSVLDELGFGHPRVDELRRRVAPASG